MKKCSNCKNNIEANNSEVIKINTRTFCCIKCKEEFFKKWSKKIKEKNLEKYGNECSWKADKIKEKIKYSNFKKYGVEYSNQCNRVIEKRKKSNLEKYGVEYGFQSKVIKDKIISTNIKKRGVKNPMQDEEIRNIVKSTCLKKYGVENPMQDEEIRNKLSLIIEEKYGKKYYFQTDEFLEYWKKNEENILKKQFDAKRKNNSFHISKIEDRCYELLINKFGKEDIERNYNKDRRYLFLCDFYIKSLDLFIECNFHWTHGKEPFDENNIQHQEILNIAKIKSLKSTYWKTFIDIWVIRDKMKIRIAKENNINYLMFYTFKEFENWFNKLK